MGRQKSSSRRRQQFTQGLARDVDKYTKQGTASIKTGRLQSALESFELAYTRASELGERYTVRACAFNLGAVYIAAGQPTKGLEILQCALPPHDQHDEKSNGDLYYNFALGYEGLNNPAEAARYLELALEEYQLEKDNFKMEAEITSKMADIYTKHHDWLRAARANGIASRAYAMLADYENQAVTTCHEASCLYQGNRPDLALQIADDCMRLCQKVQHSEALSRLYNELGLTYTQCHDFGKAATCFELALPLSRGAKKNLKRTAIILQNLGAVYNSLGDFQRAITFHEEAARQHAELKNRNAQGQCFTNLAFAYSQIGDTEKAGEFYLHSLQASRDTGDMHTQWQAMEGMGAVAFNEGQFERAVRHFKLALAVLAGTEQNQIAQERIVAKLTDAIHFMADPEETARQGPTGGVDILVNDQPRPQTREEQQQMLELAKLRKARRKLGKRQSQFIPVALGVTDYDTDSDISLQREKRKSRSRAKRSSRKLERSSSVSSTRPDVSSQIGERAGLKPHYMKLNRRPSSVPKDMVDGRRYVGRSQHNFHRSLLRTNSCDSDEERDRIINQPRRGKPGNDSVNGEYKKAMYTEGDGPRVSVVDMPLPRRPESVITHSLDTAGYHSGHVTETDTETEKRPCVAAQSVSQVGELPPEDEYLMESETDSESDSEETDMEDEMVVRNATQTLLPPAPPVPIGSLNATYLQHTPGPEPQGEAREKEVPAHPVRGGNYFKPEVDNTRDPEDRSVGDFKQIISRPAVNADIDGDPIYQTIRFAKTMLEVPGEPQPGTSNDSVTEGPALPPRPSFDTMSRAEKEAVLFDYQRKRNENIQMKADQLDVGRARMDAKKSSKTCILM